MKPIHFLGGAVVLAVAGMTWFQVRFAVPPLGDFGEVPPFSFVERSGGAVDLGALRGKVWVASFLYTRCPGPCPNIAGMLGGLDGEIARWEDVRLVTFSIDPDRDTPQVLGDYASARGASEERWMFLTGERAKIDALAAGGFKVSITRPPDQEIVHSTKVALVDRAGRIRGYYDGVAGETKERLLRDIGRLRREREGGGR